MIGLPEELLTPSMRQLVEIIGLTATLSLVERYGGTAIYVPVEAKPGLRLAICLGMEALDKLSAHYGGDHVRIDRCVMALRALRNAEIIQRHQTGDSAEKLARAYSMTSRHIWNILKNGGPPTDPRQGTLF